MTSVNVPIAKSKSSDVVATVRCRRPSSPRRFFARLYGNPNDARQNDVDAGDRHQITESDNNDNDKFRLVDVTDRKISASVLSTTNDARDDEKTGKKCKQRETLNRDNADEIDRSSEFFDDTARRKIVCNRWQRDDSSVGMDVRRSTREIANPDEPRCFDRNGDDPSTDVCPAIRAPTLVSTRLFMCRGFSSPIDAHPVTVATGDVGASTSGCVRPAADHHRLTRVVHRHDSPAPFSHLRGDLQVEARLHGFSSFLARRRKKESQPRRQRTTYSGDQTSRLEYEYNRGEYISQKRRSELAQSLNLTETQIKIWFQNRRAKYKRINKALLDQHYRNIVVSNSLVNFPLYTGSTAYLGDLNFFRDNADSRCPSNDLVTIMTREKERRIVVDDNNDGTNYRCSSSGSEEFSRRVVSPL